METLSNYERLEELAEEFAKDTGLLAPFKDAPAAVGNDPHYDRTYRQREYDKWLHAGKKGGTKDMGTLTTMLRDNLKMEPECDAEAKAIEETLHTIKATFKDWLRTVGLPWQMSEESTRQLLITLVDEPSESCGVTTEEGK